MTPEELGRRFPLNIQPSWLDPPPIEYMQMVEDAKRVRARILRQVAAELRALAQRITLESVPGPHWHSIVMAILALAAEYEGVSE